MLDSSPGAPQPLVTGPALVGDPAPAVESAVPSEVAFTGPRLASVGAKAMWTVSSVLAPSTLRACLLTSMTRPVEAAGPQSAARSTTALLFLGLTTRILRLTHQS